MQSSSFELIITNQSSQLARFLVCFTDLSFTQFYSSDLIKLAEVFSQFHNFVCSNSCLICKVEISIDSVIFYITSPDSELISNSRSYELNRNNDCVQFCICSILKFSHQVVSSTQRQTICISITTCIRSIGIVHLNLYKLSIVDIRYIAWIASLNFFHYIFSKCSCIDVNFSAQSTIFILRIQFVFCISQFNINLPSIQIVTQIRIHSAQVNLEEVRVRRYIVLN